MSEFKEKADLKNKSLKLLLKDFESKRDSLLDEVAFKRGQVSLLEETIKRIYEMVLDNNKEEQIRESNYILEQAKIQEELKAAEEKEKRKEDFRIASRGVKTPKSEKRT